MLARNSRTSVFYGVSVLLLQMKDIWYLEQMIDIKDWEGARALAGYLVDQFQLRADSHTHTQVRKDIGNRAIFVKKNIHFVGQTWSV